MFSLQKNLLSTFTSRPKPFRIQSGQPPNTPYLQRVNHLSVYIEPSRHIRLRHVLTQIGRLAYTQES